MGKFGLERLHSVLSAIELVRDRATVRTKPSVSRPKDRAGMHSDQRTQQVHNACSWRVQGSVPLLCTPGGRHWTGCRLWAMCFPRAGSRQCLRLDCQEKRVLQVVRVRVPCLKHGPSGLPVLLIKRRRRVSGLLCQDRALWLWVAACSQFLLANLSSTFESHTASRRVGTTQAQKLCLRGLNNCFERQRGSLQKTLCINERAGRDGFNCLYAFPCLPLK